MKMIQVLVFLSLVVVELCYAHLYGAPTGACETMKPKHNGQAEQPAPSPYLINVSPGNGQVEVTVNGDTDFKGILIEGRNPENMSQILDGTFTFASSLLKTVNCLSGENNAVTHVNSDPKSKVEVTWTPPNGFSGQVTFKVTVVHNFSTFWTNMESETVEVTALPVTTGLPTTTPASDMYYEGCGSTHGCFGEPKNCLGDKSCTMLTKFQADGENVNFDLLFFTSHSDSYVALGFSKTGHMSPASVVACINSASDGALVKTGWNHGGEHYGNVLYDLNYAGFSPLETSVEDGVLHCNFKQPAKWTTTNDTFTLDNNSTYLLLAHGDILKPKTLKQHVDKAATEEPIDFSQFTKAGASRLETMFDNCGETKGCFGGPSGCIEKKDCEAFVSFSPHTDGVQFDIIGNTDGFVAVGLSLDQKMGDDSVTACMLHNGVVTARDFWNTDENGHKDSTVLHNPENGLSSIIGSQNNGKISCRFIRKTKTVIRGKNFNLNSTKYYLLLAVGPVKDDGHIGYHRKNKWESATPVKLTSVSVLKGDKNIMVKVHGMLMIMAWIGTASLGMIFARYFKLVWADQLITGVKVWFFCHRLMMILTFLLTVTSFILIFIEIDGFSQVEDNPHPFLGIATTVLCVLQPFIALLRCAPDDDKRPIFNWVHWFIGNSAQILGVVAIFYASALAKANLPKYFDWIFIAFIIFHILSQMIFQTMACKNDGKSKYKVSDVQMSGYGNGSDNVIGEKSNEVKGSTGRKVLLILYVFFNISFMIALISLVWIS